jgi:hypothetical protein
MAIVQERNALGQFVKGMSPHNKKWFGKCIIIDCCRTDLKAFGLCNKHYKLKNVREKNEVFNSDLSKRLPRTKEHARNNVLYMKKPGWKSGLLGRTYKEIYGKNADKYINLRTGENNGTWKGGRSFEKYPRAFSNKIKKYIRNRDGYTCQECGLQEKDYMMCLDVHHIDFNKQNNDERNLISLCKRCHGNTQKDRNGWEKHYKDKIGDKYGS